MSEILNLNNVSHFFLVHNGFLKKKERLVAVNNVSLSLKNGESLGLVGESGCGKSTLGRIACGLIHPSKGDVLLENKKLPAASKNSWAAGKIQMIFQDPASSFNPRMTVRYSIAEPLIVKGISKQESLSKADELLKTVGLQGLGQRYPHQFSGGQRQRLAVARSLITRPSVIVCDEPVSALDASVQAQILNLLKDMQEKFNPAYIFISHDLSVVGFMCKRIHVMYLGQIVEECDREQLFEKAAHPYSRALIAAMPAGGSMQKKNFYQDSSSSTFRGELPNPINTPSGCHFHPRCPIAKPICAEQCPSWKQIAPNWRARCFFA